jgi:Tol biopolymer transport system component
MRAKPGAGPNPGRNQVGALFVVNVDGTGLRQITPYGLANSHESGFEQWSPDGKEIVFANPRGSLFLVHPDGSGLRTIPLNTGDRFFASQPGWSPDGTKVAFSLFLRDAGQVDIYTTKLDGSDLMQVTDTPEFEDWADWGPRPLAV